MATEPETSGSWHIYQTVNVPKYFSCRLAAQLSSLKVMRAAPRDKVVQMSESTPPTASAHAIDSESHTRSFARLLGRPL